MTAQQPVGCIGLGKIGLPICQNLIAGGFQVIGHRRSSLATFEGMGGTPASSAAEVATRATVVLTCVDSDAAMGAVISGPGGLAQGVRPGQIVVCLSSHPVAVKRAFAATLAERGAVLLDGEVSGTPGMVEARKAAVYLAGSRDAADTVTPVIRGFADTCLYLGAFGSATQVKLVNNFLVALHIAGTAQAMAIGKALGVDPNLMIPAIVQGSGASAQFAIRAPWMAARRFTPRQGAPSVLLHYLQMIRDAAAPQDISLELVDNLIGLYGRASRDEGDRDVAALLELFEHRSPSSSTGDAS